MRGNNPKLSAVMHIDQNVVSGSLIRFYDELGLGIGTSVHNMGVVPLMADHVAHTNGFAAMTSDSTRRPA